MQIMEFSRQCRRRQIIEEILREYRIHCEDCQPGVFDADERVSPPLEDALRKQGHQVGADVGGAYDGSCFGQECSVLEGEMVRGNGTPAVERRKPQKIERGGMGETSEEEICAQRGVHCHAVCKKEGMEAWYKKRYAGSES